MLHLTKSETSVVIWLTIVTLVARSVPPFAHTHVQRVDVRATRQLHCQ